MTRGIGGEGGIGGTSPLPPEQPKKGRPPKLADKLSKVAEKARQFLGAKKSEELPQKIERSIWVKGEVHKSALKAYRSGLKELSEGINKIVEFALLGVEWPKGLQEALKKFKSSPTIENFEQLRLCIPENERPYFDEQLKGYKIIQAMQLYKNIEVAKKSLQEIEKNLNFYDQAIDIRASGLTKQTHLSLQKASKNLDVAVAAFNKHVRGS